MKDTDDRTTYLTEYRSMLKSVLTETLHEKDSVIREICKDAIKEWLNERFKDKESILMRLLAASMIAAFAYWIFLKDR